MHNSIFYNSPEDILNEKELDLFESMEKDLNWSGNAFTNISG